MNIINKKIKKINEILPKKERLGQIGINNNGEKIIIIVYRNSKDIDIQFIEDRVIVKHKNYDNFLRGRIAHPIRYEESFAYHIEVELGLDINKIWNFEKNTVSPYEITKQSNKKVWLYCLDKDYHNDKGGYETQCNSFYKGSRCTYCGSNHKVHPKDSFAQWGIDNIDEKFLEKYWSKKNTINPYEIKPSSSKKVWIYCQNKDYHNDKGGYEITCNNFYNSGRCSYCHNFKIHKLDSLGYLYPQIAKMIVDDERNNVTMEDMYKIAPQSEKKYYFKCNKCKNGSKRRKAIGYNVIQGYFCEYCSDGISIPNKILRQISFQLGLNLQFEYSPIWLENKRLDGYDDDLKIAIEMDGEYYDNHKGKRKEVDSWKDEQCLKNGIYVIRINLTDTYEYNNNKFKYIKKQILNSPLSLIYDLSNINWELAWENSLKSLVWEVKKLKDKGYFDSKIAETLNVSIESVYNYKRQLGMKTLQEIKQENLLKVKKLLEQRKTDKEIAEILNISINTIKNYKKELN